MAKIVNLNKRRKDAERREKRARADANAVTFGLTKAEKQAARAKAARAARDLDGKKRDET